ncbi:uncharacterized protein LOC117786809 [Drosophila innubila]|uniref:uncharacterized protein LOC117786809 n=1 Tax=Drosophila innubila TaxID=198719 RepID=UPI00148E2B94|nr:uncharacterized protein LOC117786809 [Drosophila innubila]
MDLQRKLPAASPASTQCSELEYLIALQSDEIGGSQLRRSQRLREKEKTNLETRKEVVENTINNTSINDGASSPQLFAETDEEFSQLGQQPPKQASIPQATINQNVASKRANNETSVDVWPKEKRRRKSTSTSRAKKQTAAVRKPTTLSSKLNLKTNSIESQFGIMFPYPQVDNADWQKFYNPQAIVIPSKPNSGELEIKISPESIQNPTTMPQNEKLVPQPQKTEPSYQICSQPKRKSHKIIDSASGTKRSRAKNQRKVVPISTNDKVTNQCAHHQQPTVNPSDSTEPHLTVFTYGTAQNPQVHPGISLQLSYQQPTVNPSDSTGPHLTISNHGTAANPQAHPGLSRQYSYHQPTVNPPDPKPSSYQRQTWTQTLLPERYPDHFIHQLPPESTTMNGVIMSSELQRVGAETAVPDSTRALPSKELRQMCPTPDTTPTVAHESYTPSPPIADSLTSSTPSLSDSLAEVFGTRKVRNILNIEPPRKYLVLEVHLPAIAFMLDVELGRLRAVLGMTQRLTHEQVEQMTQESREVISIHSSEDNQEFEMQ